MKKQTDHLFNLQYYTYSFTRLSLSMIVEGQIDLKKTTNAGVGAVDLSLAFQGSQRTWRTLGFQSLEG